MYGLNFLRFNSHNMYEWRMQPKCCARQALKVTLLRMYTNTFFLWILPPVRSLVSPWGNRETRGAEVPCFLPN
jgi:hypothetical protein